MTSIRCWAPDILSMCMDSGLALAARDPTADGGSGSGFRIQVWAAQSVSAPIRLHVVRVGMLPRMLTAHITEVTL